LSYVLTGYFSLLLTHASLDTIAVGAVLYNHILACRRLPGLANALPIVVPEANMAHISMSLRDHVQEELGLKCLFLMEDNKGKGPYRDTAGSITSERNKRESAEMLRDLYLKPGLACFHKHFVTVHLEVAIDQDVKSVLVGQMRNYKMKRLAYKDHGGALRYEPYYSGKWTGDKNDDFVSAMLIAVYNKREFWRNTEKYRVYQRLGEQ